MLLHIRDNSFSDKKGAVMRHLRIKPTKTDTIMHVYNRIAGSSGEFPVGNVEKEQFAIYGEIKKSLA